MTEAMDDPETGGGNAAGLVAAVGDLSPAMEAEIRESERRGHLTDRSVRLLHRAGLFRMAWPVELGGPGLGLAQQVAVLNRLARVDATAAWNVAVGSLHTGFAGAYLSDEAVAEIWSGPEPVTAGQMAARGWAEPAEGGLVVGGEWSFASGIHQSNWVISGARIRGGPLDGREIDFVVPVEAVEVDRASWEVMGLEATGSYDYRITRRFVPDGWWFPMPIAPRLRGGPLFDLPVPTQTLALHLGVPLGAARRSIEEVCRLAEAKQRDFSPTTIGARESFLTELARMDCRVSAAELAADDLCRRIESGSGTGPMEMLLRGRAVTRWVTEVALEVAVWALGQGGGQAARLDHPLQRIARDLLVARQHVMVDEIALAARGAQLMTEHAHGT